MADNPYAAPKTHVEDAPSTFLDGDFLVAGRVAPVGNGWRWIADAWTFMGRQRLMFLGVFLLSAVLWVGASLIPFIGFIPQSLLLPLLYGGGVLGCEAVRRGGQLEIDHLFAGFQQNYGRLLALGGISIAISIVFGLITLAVVGPAFIDLLAGGEIAPTPEDLQPILMTLLLMVLVILALSLPLAMAMWFAPPLIVLAQLDVVTALKTSFMACLKNFLPFLVWSVLMLIFIVLATMPIFLGWFLLGPVLLTSIYVSYRDIFYETPPV